MLTTGKHFATMSLNVDVVAVYVVEDESKILMSSASALLVGDDGGDGWIAIGYPAYYTEGNVEL